MEDDLKLKVRQNLESKKYYLVFVVDDEDFDIWQFNSLANLLKVKQIIEYDFKKKEAK